ncbi:hypothetical protein HanIR_Chr10g0458241 [Helianthus annuus]|nr:hypothetical protein HanIR_Chr10g0458241 [Helianthus annuus]
MHLFSYSISYLQKYIVKLEKKIHIRIIACICACSVYAHVGMAKNTRVRRAYSKPKIFGIIYPNNVPGIFFLFS